MLRTTLSVPIAANTVVLKLIHTPVLIGQNGFRSLKRIKKKYSFFGGEEWARFTDAQDLLQALHSRITLLAVSENRMGFQGSNPCCLCERLIL